MLYYFELITCMHHKNYFRRKQHSYAACDAALAASIYIMLIMSRLCPLLFFSTKRNNREKKIEKIYIAISQLVK